MFRKEKKEGFLNDSLDGLGPPKSFYLELVCNKKTSSSVHQQDSETVREHCLILDLIATAEVNRRGNERCGDILYNNVITVLCVLIFPVDFALLQSCVMTSSHLNHQNLEKESSYFLLRFSKRIFPFMLKSHLLGISACMAAELNQEHQYVEKLMKPSANPSHKSSSC